MQRARSVGQGTTGAELSVLSRTYEGFEPPAQAVHEEATVQGSNSRVAQLPLGEAGIMKFEITQNDCVARS